MLTYVCAVVRPNNAILLATENDEVMLSLCSKPGSNVTVHLIPEVAEKLVQVIEAGLQELDA